MNQPVEETGPGLRHTPAARVSAQTAQSAGMRRLAGVSGQLSGSERIWMGETRIPPGTRSANHHHGESETSIYVLSGHPVFVFKAGGVETRIETSPGDYVYVPPFVPHREENPSSGQEAVVILARTTQEAIVVNVPEL